MTDATLFLLPYQTRALQNLQVFHDGGKRHLVRRGQYGHSRLAARESGQNCPPCGVSQGLER